MSSPKDHIVSRFKDCFGYPDVLIQSPARVNIIGEHTDYNEGLALPFASNQSIWLASKRNRTNTINILATDIKQSISLDLKKDLQHRNSFDRYFTSAINICKEDQLEIGGLDIVFGGNIPIGAGLSSSSSLSCAFWLSLSKLFGLQLSHQQIVSLASRSENSTGLEGGKMDQTTIMFGKQDHALLLDFYYGRKELVPITLDGVQFVLLNSNFAHTLIDSEYNVRREECRKLLNTLNQSLGTDKHLRHLDDTMIHEAEDKNPGISFDRLHFLIEENERVLSALRCFEEKDYNTLGSLLFESHQGLSNLYQVSCAELDYIVASCREIHAVLGARIMGGGFGGCALCLVKKDQLDDLTFLPLQNSYHKTFGKTLDVISVEASDGISIHHV